MSDIQAPIININGASADQLLADHLAACDALREAIKAVQATTPHGRDFQTARPGQYEKARDQYWNRSKRLHEVLDELIAIATDIHAQKLGK
jgi:hypothetical protein